MIDINEVIADAKAEEEAMKTYKEEFKAKINEKYTDRNEKVTISLSEYVALIYRSRDLDRLLIAIREGLELNYSKDDLKYNGGNGLINAIKVLYPVGYKEMLEQELTKEGE